MRKSFEANKGILFEDYKYFTAPETNFSVAGDPTIIALRRALDSEASGLNPGENLPEGLISKIFACLPKNLVHSVFLPADGTHSPCVAIAFKPSFEDYITFAAEYWANLVHSSLQSPIAMPRASIHLNKVERKSAGRSGRQSQELNETQSSGKTGG
jgi:hypothetical protein